jgi:glycosyltransferase involved in cell wall biosynthesis
MVNLGTVSVIIPVYNAEKFLELTLQSVINQTYPASQFIIVNDGSTDKTGEIADQFAAKNSNATVVHIKNAGVSNARNIGFQSSSSEFVAFLDADDLWEPVFLETCLQMLKEQPASAVYTEAICISESGAKLDSLITACNIHRPQDILFWREGYAVTPSAAVFKSDIVKSIGQPFDTNLSTAADQDFAIRISVIAPILAINKSLVQYRLHDNNMHKNIKRMETDHLYVYRKAIKNNLLPVRSFRNICLANLYLILAGSWWHQGKNKPRSVKFVCKAILAHPVFTLKRIIGIKK